MFSSVEVKGHEMPIRRIKVTDSLHNKACLRGM